MEGGAAASATSDAVQASAPAGSRIKLIVNSIPPPDWRAELAQAGFKCSSDGKSWSAPETDASQAAADAAAAEKSSWLKEMVVEA